MISESDGLTHCGAYLPGNSRSPAINRIRAYRIAFLIFLLIVVVPAQKTNSCVTCHSKLEGTLSAPTQTFKDDIHNARGLSCNDCHGGDPTKSDMAAAKASSTGYLGTPKGVQILAFCGKCHSDAGVMKRYNPSLRVDQVKEYLTSVHGIRLSGGDTKVATCANCHTIHSIRAPSDPLSSVYPTNVAKTCSKCHSDENYIGEYNIGHDQFEKYKLSMHANALFEKHDISAPTCNDCHGNHGATPPGVNSIANVCGQCHQRQSELFQKGPHKAPFDEQRLGECVRCHSNHAILKPTDQMTGIGKGSVCISCHRNDKGFEAAKSISASLAGLTTKMERANEILKRAEEAGMEVSKPVFELQAATDSLNQARVLVHQSSAKEVSAAIAPGLKVADAGFRSGEDAFAELHFRRVGLAVSLIFIGFLAVLVYLKIRQIERPEAE